MVVTEQGLAIKTRSVNIKRVPESERWDADSILQVGHSRSTSKLEWRGPLRWCSETQEKY